MRNKKTIFILMLFVLLIASTWDTAFSAGKVKSKGMLIAVERKGNVTSVEIDKYGYVVDPSAEILDRNRKSVSLRSFKLPVRVDFEYKYTPKGPIIILIEEIPDVVPK